MLHTEDGLQELLREGSLDRFTLCVVQVELAWSGLYRASQYGREVVLKLRRSGLRSRIYLHSYLPLAAPHKLLREFPPFRQREYHCALPPNPRDWPELQAGKMSEEAFWDVSETLLSGQSIIREMLHDLKNKATLPVDTPSESAPVILEKVVRNFFQKLSIQFPVEKAVLHSLEQELLEALKERNQGQKNNSTFSIIERFTPRFLALIPEDQPDERPAIPLKRTRWKVLFVDDEAAVRDFFAEGFRRNRIDFEVVSTPTDAMEVLERDISKNRINVLVTDIRFKDELDAWDTWQGYDFLAHVHTRCPNYLAKFAVTASRRQLRRLKNTHHFPLRAYYKDDVQNSEGAMNIFCEELRSEGDRVYFHSHNRPRLSSWRKGNSKRFARPLSHYYRAHLFDVDYYEAEQRINGLAKEYVDRILTGQALPRPIEFNGTLRSDLPEHPEGLEKFRFRTLLGRRIALALFLKDKSEEEIFYAMQSGARVTEISASKKLLFNTSLALSLLKDLPNPQDVGKGFFLRSNLLEEEIGWLVREYGADFDVGQIRLSRQELDTIILVLGDLQFTLRKYSGQLPSVQQDLERFLATDVERLRAVKQVVEMLNTADVLCRHFKLRKKFHETLIAEMEFFTHIEMMNFISLLIKN
ncbi:MAG: hypothetical protein AAF146_04920 [Bacteroidota bacterium]